MRTIILAIGKAEKDHVKNEEIWREYNITPMTAFLRQKRSRWYGLDFRQEGDAIAKRMGNKQAEGKIERG